MQKVRRKRRIRKNERRMIKDFQKAYKKEAKREMDELLLDSVGRSDYKNFKEYKNEMESFTLADVFGG